MGTGFEEVAEKLNMEEDMDEIERPELKQVKVKFDSQENDINEDYKFSRFKILQNMETTQEVIEEMARAILECDPRTDKLFARKVEIFAKLISASSEQRKDLFALHKNMKDLLKKAEVKEEDENSNKLTPEQVKEIIRNNKKSSNNQSFEVILDNEEKPNEE
jgi:hypothetical protein